jgi:hypothetical protein
MPPLQLCRHLAKIRANTRRRAGNQTRRAQLI